MGRVAIGAVLLLAACDVSRPERVVPDAGCLPQEEEREVWVDTTCHFSRCSARVARTDCNFVLSLGACPEDTQLVASPLDVFQESPYGSCAFSTPNSPAFESIQCTTCRFDLYEKTELDLQVQKTEVIDRPFRSPLNSVFEPFDGDDPLEGYLTSMAVLDDRVIVSSHDGRFGDLDCGDQAPNRMHSFDLETLSSITTRETPPCLTAIAPDPIEPGFIGVFGVRTSSIGRFDRDGNLLSSRRLRVPERVEGKSAVSLVADAGAIRVLVAGDEGGAAAYLFVLDPRTLEVRTISPRLFGYFRAATMMSSESRFIASDEDADLVWSYDANTGVWSGTNIALVEARRISNDPGFVLVHGAGDELYVSSSGLTGSAWIVSRPFSGVEVSGAAVFYEATALPWAAATWPADPTKLLVGVTKHAPDAFEARLAFLDPATRRFLPGSKEIGKGVVRALIPDKKGRVWGLLPWSGELIRVAPR